MLTQTRKEDHAWANERSVANQELGLISFYVPKIQWKEKYKWIYPLLCRSITGPINRKSSISLLTASIPHSKISLYLRLAQSLVLMLSPGSKAKHRGNWPLLAVNWSLWMSMPHCITDKASCGTGLRCWPVQWQGPESLPRPSNDLLLNSETSSPASATCCAETSVPSASGTLRSRLKDAYLHSRQVTEWVKWAGIKKTQHTGCIVIEL